MVIINPHIARSFPKCFPQGQYSAYEPRFAQYLGVVALVMVDMHFHNSILYPLKPMYSLSWKWWIWLILLLEDISKAFCRVNIQHMNLYLNSTWGFYA